MPEIIKPLFPLGRLVVTPGALAALEENSTGCTEFLERHVTGDWGEILCKEDRQTNVEAVASGMRILSAYRLEDGTRIWLITEADRSSTCCLLPSEY
ncbi:hypothetical protein PDESU_00944 [Pontiella desulfatans]|uniref:Plasmid related protein n=1 Tax=Pontiella desulfatans TaxID=2750659 RepID=A0A6C2TXR1_PONDE|nr:hypothetical protein [Pontiella desulfatans]VGO12392.1 hypothetical protein PDESU_00944 [Pontiella desulfatans]